MSNRTASKVGRGPGVWVMGESVGAPRCGAGRGGGSFARAVWWVGRGGWPGGRWGSPFATRRSRGRGRPPSTAPRRVQEAGSTPGGGGAQPDGRVGGRTRYAVTGHITLPWEAGAPRAGAMTSPASPIEAAKPRPTRRDGYEDPRRPSCGDVNLMSNEWLQRYGRHVYCSEEDQGYIALSSEFEHFTALGETPEEDAAGRHARSAPSRVLRSATAGWRVSQFPGGAVFDRPPPPPCGSAPGAGR